MSLQNTVPRSLVEERERIEEHFQRVQEDRLKLVREKISTEEKTRSGKMLDRHCQEMLMLIGEKASSPPLAAVWPRADRGVLQFLQITIFFMSFKDTVK